MAKRLEEKTVDEFFAESSGSERSSPRSSKGLLQLKKKGIKVKTRDKKTQPVVGLKDAIHQHKESLRNLSQSQPEFYKFLKENDESLLQFNDSSESEEEKVHKPPAELEVDSDVDDSDVSDEEEGTNRKSRGNEMVITLKMVNRWKEELSEPKPIAAIAEVVSAFKAAVEQAGGDAANPNAKYRVEGTMVFNAIMRLSITGLIPTVNRILRMPPGKENFQPTSSKMWGKVQVGMKSYLVDVIKILATVAEPAIVRVLLKHVLQLVPYYSAFPKIAKALLKRLVGFWSSGEESVRVLALMCIVRVARNLQGDLLEFCLKIMYMAYVKHCKFTSPTTWPMINFMKVSLVELFSLDYDVTYQHAFVYIRQLAIHLRNAITVKKKDAIKTVYNWQFIHCLYLWSHLVSTQHRNEVLQPLVYPLVQIIIGTAKLVPTQKYIPLRFHCTRALTTICRETGTFIPVLPLLVESLNIIDWNKKHSDQSWKKLDFLCALKVAKSQTGEKAFKDALVSQFYELMLDYLVTQSHTLGFPELVTPSMIQLKAFLKECKVASYAKEIKQLVDKMEENSRHVVEFRKVVTFSLGDTKAVDDLEKQLESQGTPIKIYHDKYLNLKMVKPQAAGRQIDMGKKFPFRGLEVEEEEEVGGPTKSAGSVQVLTQTGSNNSVKKRSNASTLEGDDLVGDLELSSSDDDDNDEEEGEAESDSLDDDSSDDNQ